MPTGNAFQPQDPPFRAPKAAAEHSSTYLPAGPNKPLIFDKFDGINTNTTRAGVDDKQAYWLDGFMPIGPRFLRTLYDVGTAIYTNNLHTIAFFAFGNISSTSYCLVFLNDGSVIAINTGTLTATTILAAGSIQNPSSQSAGVSQWSSTYILIVSKQTNGYFIWDGKVVYQAGTLAPPVDVTAGGSGYTSATCAASGGAGSGATFSVTVSGGAVTAVTITNPGSGYLATDTVTLTISGDGTSATATVGLAPFAISGTALEIYAGRVWICDGPVITYSAPGSFSDFSSANGGGNFTSSDSFLRVGFSRLIQTNGFLYLIADSSVNYISGVQTTGTPPVTTFTNQNADPEVGTPWAPTVTVWSRNIVFANAFGAHVSYGAAVTKISEALDGVYNTVANFGSLVPSAAKAIIFGKKVWMVLIPIIDPVSGQQVNKLFMWEGKKWWASGQSVTLNFVAHLEINSVITAYGTDGNSIYPLFNTPSIALKKTAQSKFWTTTELELTQTTTRVWGAVNYYSADSTTIELSIDNESASNVSPTDLTPTTVTWTTISGAVMTWMTAGGATMIWTANGLAILPPTAKTQNGTMIGLTAQTNCSDAALIMLVADVKVATQYRG